MAPVLSDKDVNAPVQTQEAAAAANNGKTNNGKPTGAETLEYHRQVLESKMADEKYGATIPKPMHPASPQLNNTVNVTMTTKTTTSPTKDAANRVMVPQNRSVADINAARARQQQYVSPSDDIMSPCSAKLNAFKGRAAQRAKPKSLFAQASSKKLSGENIFGAKNPSPPEDPSNPPSQ